MRILLIFIFIELNLFAQKDITHNLLIKKDSLNSYVVKNFDHFSKDKIIEFKLKLPHYPTMIIKGNKLTNDAIKRIKQFKRKSVYFIIFDVKTKNYNLVKNGISFQVE